MVGKLRILTEESMQLEELLNKEVASEYVDLHFNPDSVDAVYRIAKPDEDTLCVSIGGSDYTLEYDEVIHKTLIDRLTPQGKSMKA